MVELFQILEEADSKAGDTVPSVIRQMLQQFQSVFEAPTVLPQRRHCDHTIPLISGATLVKSRPYRYAPALKDEIEKQVQEMLTAGIIQPSSSAFSSPILLVKKKDSSWRFCVDYICLNALTVKGKFSLPVIDELMDELAGVSWFFKLDLRAGYHQIRLAPGEEYKTTFQTHSGLYEFRVLAFGLCGAPNTFQSAMNATLAPLLRKCVLVFYDILVYNPTLDQHVHHLEQFLQLLAQARWQVKQSKCSFAKNSIDYLGHVISASGVSTNPSKIQAIYQWPIPKNIKQLRSFLGLAGYYHKFVRNFGVISKPLMELLKKDTLFSWTSQHDAAFTALQLALVSAPVLALPNFAKPFQLETNASDTSIGVVLLQDKHPLAFVSKALGPRTRGLPLMRKNI
jgi:hypothetical protein